MLAEVLSRRAPQRVRSMVLSGTGLYGPEDVARLEQRLAAARSTPETQLREVVLTSLRSVWKDSDEADFWVERVDAAYRDGGREGTINSYLSMLDLAHRVHEFDAASAWQGPVLILKAEDDPLITQTHTRRLVGLHPGCVVRTFPDGGHSLLISRTQEYTAAVTEFLEQHPMATAP
jgi:pimeloyl-ACP methyl ester carboxylesterase